MTRLRVLALGLLALLALPGLAMAFQPYQKTSFEQAVKSGKPVLVHIHADW